MHFGAVEMWNYLFSESVQQSLERKFGKNGGKIPITPSESFETRIAVSFHGLPLCNYLTISTSDNVESPLIKV